MDGQEAENRTLAGQFVALRGRLAWMTRAEALALVRAHGGEWVASVTPRTSILVLGQASGPLGKDGRPSRWLLQARKLERQGTLNILAEDAFLARLGQESPPNAQRLTTAQLSQVLGVSPAKVHAWMRVGLIQPADTARGIHYFDFGAARWAKTLCALAGAGVSASRIRRSLQQLKGWLPGADLPLSQLAVLERDGKLLVRGEDGSLSEPSGQALLDFGNEVGPAAVSFDTGPQTAEEWLAVGREQEEAGQLAEAAAAYRQALTCGGPDAPTCFNLGNVLYAQGRHEQASERFRQAVEIDPAFAAAWNNLGVVLAELGEHNDGVAALRKALDFDAGYADAHYNLADALEQLGRAVEAKRHWQAYLCHGPNGPWGEYARWKMAQAEEA